MTHAADIGKIYAILDSPVWLVTAANGEQRGGLIATTVTQASIVESMPRQLITVNKRHHTHRLIEASGAFALHLIDEAQLELVWRFGMQSGRNADKLAGLNFHVGQTGSPLLSETVAWLDCRVEGRIDTGDRMVYLAEVIDSALQRDQPPLTSRRLFELAPEEKRKIMKEQYAADSRLDALAIEQWRSGRQ